MTMVNQQGKPIEEEHLFAYVDESETLYTDQDRNDAIALLLCHFGMEIVRTNATKHGNTELVLRKTL